MKGKAVASSLSSFRSMKEAERFEELIENLIRFIANTQVKTLTNEAALAKSGEKINELTTRCDILEKSQQELLEKMVHLEHRLETLTFSGVQMTTYPM